MKPKNLIILVAVAAVLAGVAFWTQRGKGTVTPDVLGKDVLPELPVNDVAKIVVETRDATTTVARVEGTWVASSKYNYPAAFDKVRGALMKLSELKVGQLARLNDEQRSKLKINPPAGDNGGTLLSLYDGSGKSLASLLMGETHERKSQGGPQQFGGFPDGRFVSTDNGKTVYLVDETLSEVSSTTKDWLETDLLNVTGNDVMEVSVTGPDRAPVKLQRPEKGKTMELEGLAENEELQTSKIYGIESAISYLRLSDVASPELTDEQLGLDKAAVFQATTVKGEIYTVKLGGTPEASGDRYIRIACALKPADPEPERTVPEGETEEEKKAAEEKAKEEAQKSAADRKELEDKVKELNDKLGKWTFVVESYKADSMLTKRADLVEEKKKEEEEEEKEDTSGKPAPAAAKPVAKPAAKPAPAAVKPVAKPAPAAAKPVAKPAPVAAKPVAKPVAKPAPVAAKPIAKPVAKPAPAAAKPVVTKPVEVKPVAPAQPAKPTAKKPATESATPPAKTE